ncbi:hypothetical protein DHEL01_v210230 [Diaporthe helianthi]|uniref:Uncharacterized protein n=1 Tax=Diaporthe helianthi TaxID=158607 RepID=A0A2P5HMA9_DIAHE|nr:hypothetical protein DHEL01_v210230 [Diaporthe helianthi]
MTNPPRLKGTGLDCNCRESAQRRGAKRMCVRCAREAVTANKADPTSANGPKWWWLSTKARRQVCLVRGPTLDKEWSGGTRPPRRSGQAIKEKRTAQTLMCLDAPLGPALRRIVSLTCIVLGFTLCGDEEDEVGLAGEQKRGIRQRDYTTTEE